MDFGDILKSFDKNALGVEADAYFERLDRIMSICYHMWSIDNDTGEEMLKKFTPVIELITEKINAQFEEYTKKNGEL